MMPLRSWISLAILGVVLFGILNVLERLENQAKAQRQVKLPPIDYTFHKVRYTALDEQGNLRLEVNSERMQHERAERRLTMHKPLVTRFVADQQAQGDRTQKLTAQRALVFEEGKRVDLLGGVEINSASNDDPIKLNTAELTLLPEERRGFTDGRVQIQQASAKLTGRGLIADFAAQTLEIQHDVRATIPPVTR